MPPREPGIAPDAQMTHFQPSEFYCRCLRPDCIARRGPHRLFGMHMDRTREYLGGPIIVLSGNRCPERNAEVGGVDNSEHTYADGCLGADIKTTGSRHRWRLMDALRVAGITRVGVYTDGHVHVGVGDMIDPKTWPPNVLWVG